MHTECQVKKSEDLEVDGRILKLMLNKLCERMWTGFIWVSKDTSDEPSGSTKVREFNNIATISFNRMTVLYGVKVSRSRITYTTSLQYALYSRELLLSIARCYYATVLTLKDRPIQIQTQAFKTKIIGLEFTILDGALYFAFKLKALF
jgi:hypothetical protein